MGPPTEIERRERAMKLEKTPVREPMGGFPVAGTARFWGAAEEAVVESVVVVCCWREPKRFGREPPIESMSELPLPFEEVERECFVFGGMLLAEAAAAAAAAAT